MSGITEGTTGKGSVGITASYSAGTAASGATAATAATATVASGLLAEIDKAISDVDSCVQARVRARTVSNLPLTT